MKISAIASALAAVCLTSFDAAATIDVAYNDFSDVSGLQLNDRAATIGNAVTDDQGRKVLRLTDNYGQKGSAFLKTAVSLGNDVSFTSFFQFRMTQGDGFYESGEFPVKGADGIVFVVNPTNDTTGGAGDGIGYKGFWFGAGVEFDTFNNGNPLDVDGNHVGVDLGGSVDSVVAKQVTEGLMNNGQVWSAWVDYNGVTDLLAVRVSQGASALRPETAFLTHTVDLDAVVQGDDVYFGFTSATGSLRNHHDILRWEVETIPVSAPIPEPGTLALFGLGGLALAYRARRRA